MLCPVDRAPMRGCKRRKNHMSSGNIVERLRAMAADLERFPRDKVEDELSEAADVIERLRAELDRLLPPASTDASHPPVPPNPQAS